MEEYRLAAKLKYEREEAIREQLEQEQLEKEALAQREYEIISKKKTQLDHAIQEWDELLKGWEQEPELTLHLLHSLFQSVIVICQEIDSTYYWKSRIEDLIYKVNEWLEVRKSSLEESRELSVIMNEMITKTGLEAEIVTMDTEHDEKVALEAQLAWQDELVEQFVEPIEFPLLNHQVLPIASLTQRTGLTVMGLRNLAKMHGLPSTGLKTDLCIRLERNGLIRLV